MENSEMIHATELDALVSDNKMQMLKAAIPYIPATQQQVLSVYVKYLELDRTIQLVKQQDGKTIGICSISEQKRNTKEMLKAIKKYCTDTEREMIDLFMNFFSAFQMYHTYQDLMPKENMGNTGIMGNVGNTGNAEKNKNRKEEGKNPMEALKNMLSPEQKAMLDTYSTLLSSIK